MWFIPLFIIFIIRVMLCIFFSNCFIFSEPYCFFVSCIIYAELFNTTIMPTVTSKITALFNYSGK